MLDKNVNRPQEGDEQVSGQNASGSFSYAKWNSINQPPETSEESNPADNSLHLIYFAILLLATPLFFICMCAIFMAGSHANENNMAFLLILEA